jgi:hypothetical protein
MKNTETKNQDANNNVIELQGKVEAFLTKDGEAIVHLLPGDGTITMRANFYKSIFGAAYTTKAKSDQTRPPRRYGFNARPKVYISQDGEYLIHQVPGFRVARHVNFYKSLLGIEFTSKSQTSQKKKAQA